jgi:hypothetical protein
MAVWDESAADGKLNLLPRNLAASAESLRRVAIRAAAAAIGERFASEHQRSAGLSPRRKFHAEKGDHRIQSCLVLIASTILSSSRTPGWIWPVSEEKCKL